MGVLFLAVLLAACASTPEPAPTPFRIQHLATTPELETIVASWLTAYNAQSERGRLHLEILPRELLLSSMDNGAVEMAILGEEPPEDWFATPLAKEAIAVIVTPEITIHALTILDLENLYSGRIKTWESFSNVDLSVHLVLPFKGDVFRKRFDQVVMQGSRFDPAAVLASTPDVILEHVRTNPAAIGFLPVSQVDEGAEVVAIDGFLPGDDDGSGQYPLWVDVIATSPQEPTGSLRTFLGWLQGTYLSRDDNNSSGE